MPRFKSVLVLLLLLVSFDLLADTRVIDVGDGLKLTRISDNVYIHTFDNSNGIVYIDNGEAILVSTPWSDKATADLIDWTENELKAKIVGYVIDRWHPDAMEGLDVVQQRGIKSYANQMTRDIAREKGLPVPDIGFKAKLELKVGSKTIVCRYFGEAHTSDGIVVWLPAEKVLFGGNEIRNNNGWVGNIGDANLNEWSATIERVKKAYGDAKVVIPGHGPYGGAELIDYTITLYRPSPWGTILKNHDTKVRQVFSNYGDIFEVADGVEEKGAIRSLQNATVFVIDRNRYLKIDSPLIEHDVTGRSVRSEQGRLKIFTRKKNQYVEDTDLYYRHLTVDLRDDAVGILIVLKEMIR